MCRVELKNGLPGGLPMAWYIKSTKMHGTTPLTIRTTRLSHHSYLIMPLAKGIYIIRSVVDGRGVGRHPIEDRSLLPKAIRALPDGIAPPQVPYNLY